MPVMGRIFDRIERRVLTTVITVALTIASLAAAIVIIPLGFVAVGELTGWYRIEDHMCKLPEECK
jgi:hypothetical protein